MKLLFLNFWAQHLGGAEHSLLDIISFAAANHETILITSEEGDLTERAKLKGCRCIAIPCSANVSIFRRNRLFLTFILHFKSFLLFLLYSIKIRNIVSSLNPDVIHSNVPKSHMILFFLVLTGFKKLSFIHIREIFLKNSFPFLLYKFLFNANRSSIIAISHAVLTSLPQKLQKKTIVIYNGVHITQVDYKMRSNNKRPRFLYFGRVVPWKGCDLLIDAFKMLYDKYKEHAGSLSIIGGTYYWNNSYRECLIQQISQLNCNALISLEEYTSNISSVYLTHTILCLPSIEEPFGRVAAEAMAYKLPVLGFQSGGLPEIIEHGVTGLLSPIRSCESLYQMMSEYIEKPELIYEMGINGHKRCRELFNKEIQIKKIITLITS